MWAISSTDTAERLALYGQSKGITFPLLSDAGLAVTRRYGVLNDTRGNLAYPTTLVVDKQGIVRYVRVDVDFTKRPPATELLDLVKSLAK